MFLKSYRNQHIKLLTETDSNRWINREAATVHYIELQQLSASKYKRTNRVFAIAITSTLNQARKKTRSKNEINNSYGKQMEICN